MRGRKTTVCATCLKSTWTWTTPKSSRCSTATRTNRVWKPWFKTTPTPPHSPSNSPTTSRSYLWPSNSLTLQEMFGSNLSRISAQREMRFSWCMNSTRKNTFGLTNTLFATKTRKKTRKLNIPEDLFSSQKQDFTRKSSFY